MRSTDLCGFSRWLTWGSEALRQASARPGVYAFRLAGRSFGRFKGESDIVYIGSGTVRDRLTNHLSDRDDAPDICDRLHDPRKGAFEVAWKILATSQEAEKEEGKLLLRYYLDHWELPPADDVEPNKQRRKDIEALERRG